MNAWKRTRNPEVQKVGWRWLTTKWFLRPDGVEGEFVTIGREGADAAAIIALTSDNQVVVAKQFRAGPEKVMAELPGGIIDEGETSEQAVLRELQEETGYVPERIEYLGKVHYDGYHTSVCHYYIGYNCQKRYEQETDETEQIDVQLISINELIANGHSDNMSDTGALFLAYEKLQKLIQEKSQ